MRLIMQLFRKVVELVVIRNALDTAAEDIDIYEGYDVVKLLKHAFATNRLPAGVKLFHGGLGEDCDVTPTDEAGVARLLKLEGRVYAVLVPRGLDPISWLVIGASILISVGIALLMPMMIPTTGAGSAAPSPNNALAQRVNRQRLGGRIPDIVGQVWAVPDQVSPPYSLYDNHEEKEYSIMCVGRGAYHVAKAYDDTTDVTQIAGTSVEVYDPNVDIKTGVPTFTFGNAMTAAEKAVSRLAMRRYTSVNGQVLPRPDNFLTGVDNISFGATNRITITGDNYTFDGIKVTANGEFGTGDKLRIEGALELKSSKGLLDAEGKPVTYNLNGEYEVVSTADKLIVLKTPSLVNADWQKLNENADTTVAASPTLSTESDNLWLDWQYTTDANAKGVVFNLVAGSGIYAVHEDGDKFAPFNIAFEYEIEQVDDDNAPIAGTKQVKTVVIGGRGAQVDLPPPSGQAQGGWLARMALTARYSGNDEVRRTAGKTFFVDVTGKTRFRIRRISKKNEVSKQIVDEVKIKDFYSYREMSGVGETLIDDCTLVCIKTSATEGALSVKERKLKLLATRYIYTPAGTTILSKKADDIIYHLSVDPLIGNLTDAQIDDAQIKAELSLLRAYFSDDKMGEFSYTFDNIAISSEETLQTVAEAVFCQLYRSNNKLRIHFERPQPVGVAIFNSHNIVPETFESEETFGILKDHDGVIVKHIDPVDDAQVTLQYPPDLNLINPDEYELIGVRNKAQAEVHAKRIWNKHLYSYRTVSFTATDESNIVVNRMRIDVADQMRAGVMEGTVVDLRVDPVYGIVLELSDYVSDALIQESHTIFIQMLNGQIDHMTVAPLTPTSVVLPRLPLHAISSSLTNVVQATYMIVHNRNAKRDAFILTEKDAAESLTNKLTAMNYDVRYYDGDIKKETV